MREALGQAKREALRQAKGEALGQAKGSFAQNTYSLRTPALRFR
jgi:hypothetical protein